MNIKLKIYEWHDDECRQVHVHTCNMYNNVHLHYCCLMPNSQLKCISCQQIIFDEMGFFLGINFKKPPKSDDK